MSRKKHEHWLIGLSTSVLKIDFVTKFSVNRDVDITELLPFNGPQHQLPTEGQAWKFWWFLSDEFGRMDQFVSNGSLTKRVALLIERYWSMAGFETINVNSIHRGVKTTELDKLVKDKSKSSPNVIAKGEAFIAKINTLLYVGATDLREQLSEDRVRCNLGVPCEDLEFLDDQIVSQMGPRLRVMGKEDTVYSFRKEANSKRKSSSLLSAKVTEDRTVKDNDPHEEPAAEDDGNDNDDDYNSSIPVQKPDEIRVIIPTNLISEELAQLLTELKLPVTNDTVKLGLPVFPDLSSTTELCDLVAGRSRQLFTTARMDPSWVALLVPE